MALPLQLPDVIKTLKVLCNQMLLVSYQGGFPGLFKCVCIAQLNCSRFRSVEVGKPMVAGPGMSVT